MTENLSPKEQLLAARNVAMLQRENALLKLELSTRQLRDIEQQLLAQDEKDADAGTDQDREAG